MENNNKKEEELKKGAEARERKEAEAEADKDKNNLEVEAKKTKNKVILKNTLGKEMKASDYFYKGVISSGFEGTCGKPVEREDLLDVFNKVFKPADNILFYKQVDKEVYLIIIPIKYSVSVGEFNDSMEGDFQKHAISFLDEGSVNLDTLRHKLERITKFVKYSDR